MAGMSQYVVSILFQGKDQTGTAAKSAAGGITKLAGSVKNLLAGYGMLKGAQQALNFVKMGAEVGRASASLDSLAKAAGTSGKEIVSSMQDASLNTIDRMTAMQTANRALIMDVAKTPEQFERLAKVATVLGRAMGKDAASSIDDFVTAAGRQSKLIADNLGLIINAEDAYQKYADTLGITVDELDDAGKKQAFLTEMLRQGEAKMGALDSTTRDAAGDFEALNAAFKDMKTGSAEVVAELVRMGGGLDWVIGRLKGFPDTLKQLATLSIAFSEGMNAATLSIMTSPNAIRAGESAWEAFQTSILRSTRGAIEGTSEIQRYGYTIQEAGEIARYAATTDLPALEQGYAIVTGTVEPLNAATRIYLDTLAETETISGDFATTSRDVAFAIEQADWAAKTKAVQEHAAAIRTAEEAQLGLNTSLKDADREQIGRVAIGELDTALSEGKITWDEYRTAVSDVQLAFGLADEKSIALGDSILDLVERFADGQVEAAKFDDELNYIATYAGEASGQVQNLGNEINLLPTEKTVTIRVRTITEGTIEDPLNPDSHQHGGRTSGGYSWVGERGKELVRLPAGSRVYNHTQSNNYNLNVSSLQQSRGIAMDFAMMRAMGG